MKRLIDKDSKQLIVDLDLVERLGSREKATDISMQNAFSKLSKIEDIEEEIKMSLVDFYKCIISSKDEFYIIVEDEDNEQLKIVEVFKKNDGAICYVIQEKFYFTGESKDGFYYEYPFSSYGEDLFLTLEEAEIKLKELKNGNNNM